MSHLRDLQRLRNTKKTFQIKHNTGQQNSENKIQKQKSVKKYQNQQQQSSKQQIFIPKLIDLQQDNQLQNLAKYLQSKQILLQNDNKFKQKQSLVRINQKYISNNNNHKRGNSIVGSNHNNSNNPYYDLKSRQMAQSGLSVYNFSIKVNHGNTTQAVGAHGPQSQVSGRKSHLGHQDKDTQLLVDIGDNSPSLRHSHGGSKTKRGIRGDLKINLQGTRKNTRQDENYLMGKNSFQIICPIGKGGFGKVWKVKYKKTGEIFAMKQMQKIKIINKKSINSVMNQKILLAELQHPFIVNIKSSFQDRENLYLVMDYLNGGDLRYHIGCKGKFNQIQAKFFIANILIGLQYLHSHKILHRDLKPQNFVLDSMGYLRITDLGVARLFKLDNHKDTSGTPGYMSPEVICHKNHTYTADYFALGVIGYEFMLGRRPYNGRNRKQIRQHILTKQVQVKIDQLPYRWSPKSADFINQVHCNDKVAVTKKSIKKIRLQWYRIDKEASMVK